MPDCDKALELISAHIDGALTDAEEARLTQHLNTCPACRALLADLEEARGTVRVLMDDSANGTAVLEQSLSRMKQAGYRFHLLVETDF